MPYGYGGNGFTAPIMQQINRTGDYLMYADQARRRDELMSRQGRMDDQQTKINAFTLAEKERGSKLSEQHRNAFSKAWSAMEGAGLEYDPQGFAKVYVMAGGSPEMALKMLEDQSKGLVKVGENESLYSPYSGQTVAQGGGSGLTGEAKNLKGLLGRVPTMEEYEKHKKDIARAGATSVTVDVNKKSMVALGEEMGKDLMKERTKVESAISSMNHLEEAKTLLDKGVITGKGAGLLTEFGSALSTIGIKNFDDPVANTQAFVGTMGRQVGENIKMFGAGTGLSDADRQYAEKMAGGQIELNEKAIRKIIDINQRQARYIVTKFNEKAGEAMKKPGADQLPYDLRVDLKSTKQGPPQEKTETPTKPAAQAPQPAIEFLRKNPGQKEAFKMKYGYLPEGF